MSFELPLRNYLVYVLSLLIFAALIQSAIDSVSIIGRTQITIFFFTPLFVILWIAMSLKQLGKRALLIGGAALLAWIAPAIWIASRIFSGLGGHSHIEHENIILIAITLFNIVIMLTLVISHGIYKQHT